MTTIVSSFRLPQDGGCASAPLFSLVVDQSDNLYCSDEFNHSVFSLNSHGELRWRTGGQGREPGQFWYPRGLALGWIRVDGRLIHCLAVADAWNRRVQFLDEEGTVLSIWPQSGVEAFAEINDVRFIPGSESECGFWLVLDREKHRLSAFDLSGNGLFQIGRGAPEKFAESWNPVGMATLNDRMDSGIIPFFAPCDINYYPTRILGNSEQALFLTQPGSGQLKRVWLGNLLPVSVESTPEMWIGADQNGLAGFAPNCIRFYDFDGSIRNQIPIAGSVVPSNLPLSQFWVQLDDRLDRISVAENAKQNPVSGNPVGKSSIGLDRKIAAAVDRIVRSIESLIEFSYEISRQFEARSVDAQGPARAQNRLNDICREIKESRSDFYRLLHAPSIDAALHRLGTEKTEVHAKEFAFLDSFADRLRALFPRLVEASDVLYRLQSAGFPSVCKDSPALEKFRNLAVRLEEVFSNSVIHDAVMWIYKWAYNFDDPILGLSLPRDRQPGFLIARPAEQQLYSLRTICSKLARPDRMAVAADGSIWFTDFQEKALYRVVDGTPRKLSIPGLLHPQALLIAQDGLYVGDRTGGALWRMPQNGSPERLLSFPGEEVTAIATDRTGASIYVAVYASDRNTGRVLEFDRQWKQAYSIGSIDARPIGMVSDMAVCPGGNLVVVEWEGSNGVWVSSSRGSWICRLSPPVPLPSAHSRALCTATDDDGSVFVSDHWFGRVWHYAPDMTFLGGLGDGILSHPAGLSVNGGRLLVSDAGNGKIWEFNRQAV